MEKQLGFLQARVERCLKEARPWNLLSQIDLLIAVLEARDVEAYRMLLAEYPAQENQKPEFFGTRAQIDSFLKAILKD